jgi:hypothetical protein
MKLGLIAILVLLVAQGNAMEDDSSNPMDADMNKSNYGFAPVINTNGSNIGYPPMIPCGTITINIYEYDDYRNKTNKKLVFSRDENITQMGILLMGYEFFYACKYIPYSKLESSQLEDEGFVTFDVVITYTTGFTTIPNKTFTVEKTLWFFN